MDKPKPTTIEATPDEVEIATHAFLNARNWGLTAENSILAAINAINQSRCKKEISK